jgi:hypothetical protein
MSVQVSCPVFRCPKTSVSQCTGHRRACSGYYCQTHTTGTLCERCVSLKQAEMKSSYRDMVRGLERKAYSASRTAGVVALLLISIVLLAVGGVCWFLQTNDQSILPVVPLAVGFFGFFGALVWYLMKAREYMRAESVELDLKYPGFYDYYQQYQAKIDEITSSSNINY